MVCRIKTIQTSRSHVSCVGQALGGDRLENAKGPLFQTIKITVTDTDRLPKQRNYGGITGVPILPHAIFVG